MMDRNDGTQQKLLCVTLESLMPERHFLRDLDRMMDFSFIYSKVEGLYSHTGRRSIDPVVVVKMLLLGYLYGIDSERRLEQEIQVNIAYRWFLGIDLDEPVPDHSTLSQLRRRKFQGTAIFEEIFTEIVRRCISRGLISGKLLLMDSTHVRANARNDLTERRIVDVEPSAYLQRLNEEAEREGFYPKHKNGERELTGRREVKVSKTDPESGFMNRPGKPPGFHYLSHQTCDAEHGLITDVFVTPGNENDAPAASCRIQHQINAFGFEPEAVCADRAYDSAELHHDMLLLGIKTYIPRQASHEKEPGGRFSDRDFRYDKDNDRVICPAGETLRFSSYNPKTGSKRYSARNTVCSKCSLREKCLAGKMKRREIHRACHKWAAEEQHEKNDGTPQYHAALRLRKIWCEGNFSHQKALHNLRRTRKRGLSRAFEHCLLSAAAFNLKRMVRLLTARPGYTKGRRIDRYDMLRVLRKLRARFLRVCQQ